MAVITDIVSRYCRYVLKERVRRSLEGFARFKVAIWRTGRTREINDTKITGGVRGTLALMRVTD